MSLPILGGVEGTREKDRILLNLEIKHAYSKEISPVLLGVLKAGLGMNCADGQGFVGNPGSAKLFRKFRRLDSVLIGFMLAA